MLKLTEQLGRTSENISVWMGRGTWTVIDRAFFTGINFLINLFLARWLPSSSYGAFATTYSVYLLLLAIHTALWTEPMLVYGSSRFASSFVSYHQILAKHHWRLGGLGSLGCMLLAVIVLLLGQKELAFSFLSLGIAAPLILYLWLVSRTAYALWVPRLAAYGSGVFFVLYLVGVYSLHRIGWLNAGSALLAMGVAGISTASWLFSRLRTQFPECTGHATTEDVRSLHLNYGRWSLLAGIFSWIPFNWYFIIAPVLQTLEESGSLRAYANLFVPALQFLMSLSPLLITVFARKKSGRQLFLIAGLIIAFMWIVSIIYSGLLFLFRDQALFILYKGKYLDIGSNIPYIAPMLIGSSIAVVLNSALRATEQIRIVSSIYLVNALLTVSLGSVLFYNLGLTGYAITLAIVQICSGMMFSIRLISISKGNRTP